jgi:hypothetical protein
MSTIQVSARGLTTVREALDEVDAVVEVLKERADEVVRMMARELEGDGDGARASAMDAARRVSERARDAAEHAPEVLHLHDGGHRASGSRGRVLGIVVLGLGVAVAAAVWRQRKRTRELRAVENTAPDEFGATLERAELAGTIRPRD